MQDAGCVKIAYGVKSYSQDILNRMGKQINVKQIVPAINLTKQVGIEPYIFYITGTRGKIKNLSSGR